MGFFESLLFFFTSKYVIITVLAVLLLSIIGRLTKLIPVRVFEVFLGILIVLILIVICAVLFRTMNIGSVTGTHNFWQIFH
ncbi:MAG: hypothetical protein II399_10170 [Lachnospiraceae bacterium]|nr:hypothetical protein [Lachnospiraceae bacterium]